MNTVTERRLDVGAELMNDDKQQNPFAAAYQLKEIKNQKSFFLVETTENARALLDIWPNVFVVTHWDSKYSNQCADKRIFIASIPHDKAQEIAEGLYRAAAEVRIVNVNSMIDFVRSGGIKETFIRKIKETSIWVPEYSPLDWNDPIPLVQYDSLPDFPLDELPSIGREMAEAVATVTQVDTGLAGSVYLGVLSSCLGGKVKVDIKSHTEPCNLYLVQVAESGERKSATVNLLTSPIYNYQKQKAEDLKPKIREAENKYIILQKRLEKKQQEAAKTDSPIERQAFITDAEEISKELELHP